MIKVDLNSDNQVTVGLESSGWEVGGDSPRQSDSDGDSLKTRKRLKSELFGADS